MPTFTTTVKHALRALTGTNLVSDIDAGILALAQDVDGKLTPFTQGLLADRPGSTVGSPGKPGRLYLATDVGELYIDTGTGWTPLNVARPEVTTLPSSPYDGQEVAYVADSTNGVIWHLRYRADAPSAPRWEFIGGNDLVSIITTDSTRVETTYGNLFAGGVGPTIHLPLWGDFWVEQSFYFYAVGGSGIPEGYMSYMVDMVAPDPGAPAGDRSTGGTIRSESIGISGVDLTAVYAVNSFGGTGHFSNRVLRVRPRRVS